MLSEEQILHLIRERVDHPATAKELQHLLRVPAEERATFRRRLRALVASGALVEIRGHRFGLPDRMNLVVGRVSTNPRGFAFVDPEAPGDDGPKSIYIAGNNLNQAMHGDRVVVRVEHRRDGDRAEGRILRILERGTERIVGRYDLDEAALGFVVPFDRRLIMDVQVPKGETRRRHGAARWSPSKSRAGRRRRGRRSGASSRCSGRLDAPGVDTAVIIRKYNLPDRHSDDAIAEAKRLGTAVKERDIQRRTDFRAWPTVTIDGENARDFDDAISIDRLPNGNFWLGVHIADVSHYVTEGSALDAEAYEREHVGVLPRARGAHVSGRAVDRALQPESARRSAGAVVPDGSRSPHRRGRPLRDARRRDPQPGADDLHRRQRDPDGSRSGSDGALPCRSCRCSSGCTSCSRS